MVKQTEGLSKKELHQELLKELKIHGLKLSAHSKKRMVDRGYNEKDVAHVLLSGRLIKSNSDVQGWEMTIFGKDSFQSPCIIVVGRRYGENQQLVLITIMPPIHKRYTGLIKKIA